MVKNATWIISSLRALRNGRDELETEVGIVTASENLIKLPWTRSWVGSLVSLDVVIRVERIALDARALANESEGKVERTSIRVERLGASKLGELKSSIREKIQRNTRIRAEMIEEMNRGMSA